MIQLSDHFTYRKLLRFTFPSIVMMIFTSIYIVVDGFFVSNFAGKAAFTAVNFIMPFLMILGSVGFIFGTGGGALIAKKLGEGAGKKANEIFSMILFISTLVGVVLGIVGIVFLPQISAFLGAEGQLLSDCVLYGRVYLAAIPAFILQYEFQCLFVTAGKPQLGLYITLAAGLTNMVLDAVFVGIFSWGLAGAAAASGISQCVGGVLPLIYFARPNTSLLRLVKFKFDGSALLKTCSNGASELLSNISMSLVGVIYNIQLLHYAGEDGIAAYGVILYVCMFFQAITIGYAVGVAPIVSYHYGAKNPEEVKGLLKKSLLIISITSLLMFAAGELLARPLSMLFVSYDQGLLEMTLRGFWIFSVSFLFFGFSVFASSFFTALNNGLVSATISFLRTMVFQIAAVLIVPLIWDLDGIWSATVWAEAAALLVAVIFLIANRKKYQYGKSSL